LKSGDSHEPVAAPVVDELSEGADAKSGATPEIIPLASRTKEGMADLVEVLKGLPGEHAVPCKTQSPLLDVPATDQFLLNLETSTCRP
jgi:hypothetical protein